LQPPAFYVRLVPPASHFEFWSDGIIAAGSGSILGIPKPIYKSIGNYSENLIKREKGRPDKYGDKFLMGPNLQRANKARRIHQPARGGEEISLRIKGKPMFH